MGFQGVHWQNMNLQRQEMLEMLVNPWIDMMLWRRNLNPLQSSCLESLKDREAKSADWDEGFFRWGCDRAVDGPQLPSVLAPLGPSGVGGCEAISELQWGLWGVCVTGGSFPHLC